MIPSPVFLIWIAEYPGERYLGFRIASGLEREREMSKEPSNYLR